ncbi:phage portal protein [Paenibacillus taichungensis]|uniref:HK97 family phage portal protein n=2 Tax=Paenibacillus pabuli TaxID=1472 RepID=A0A855XT93_9BACL|nr:HK97 family phage portal protein [Paenibacillus pabuli]PXW05532.1 HK97 family phage portal protein [Paenibacillus taichungensis]
MKWHQRLRGAVKGAVRGATSAWKGAGFDFTSWAGRMFWGVENGELANNETIFSVITRLANTISALPLRLYREYDVVTDHNSAELLINTPNPNMGGVELLNKMEVSRNETGDGYAIIERDLRMQPVSITPVDPLSVTPMINIDDNVLWYMIQGVNKTYYVHNMDMLHVKHITGATRWKGISPIKVLRNTLEYDKAVQEFSLSEMQKKDSFILSYGANVDKEKRERIVGDFKRFYQENGGILFQEPGVEIKDIEKRYFSSDTLASERITRSRVANVFNIPVSFLNDTEGQSYSSNEQMMIQFVQMKLTPDVRQYEQEFNRKLLTAEERRSGYYFKLNMGGLLRGDMAARTAFYQMMIRGAGIKPNEIRRLEDFPPVNDPKADELWISGDMYPLSMDPTLRKATAGIPSTPDNENSNERG